MSWRPVALALTLLLPGLAVAETPPQSPAGGQAVIELARGYRHATVIEGGQSYRIGQGETCATATPSVSYPHYQRPWYRETVAAGRRTVISALSRFYTHPARRNGYRFDPVGAPCDTAIRFTPEAGHTYRVTQHVSATRPVCFMEVIDTATGRPPPSLDPRRLDECSLYRDPVSP